ncbi:MAG: SusD/RagB family nutrient-binding outer membrane lipoprotein [Bacteroidota bacterium]
MKLLNYKHWSLMLVISIMASCSQFEEMNYDPNKPTVVPTSGLLKQAQANLVYNMNGELAQLGSQYVQHFTQLEYVEKSNYDETGISSFTGMYRSGLFDLTEIVRLNESDFSKGDVLKYGDNNNQIAVANILKAWVFHNMTDIWGEIPYSEALRGREDIITPKYDTQEQIYDDLITQLENAIDLITISPEVPLQGDLIFNGNMTKWKAFAASLRLRIAMRLSEVDDTKANALINDADFANAFSTSSDYAHFTHFLTQDESNPIYYDNIIRGGGDYHVPSNTMLDYMILLNDPRISTYVNVAVNTGTYVGLEVGIPANSEDDISLINDNYGGQEAPSILMTGAEVLFIKAEAAQRGYIGGDAATFYNDAITASMEYNGVDAADIATYLAEPEVAYDVANWQEKIGAQKWLALYAQGVQAWAEWRRLDYPVLTPGVNAIAISSGIPRRRAYTSDEYSTNSVNVTEAVERSLGGKDLFTGSVWWDK